MPKRASDCGSECRGFEPHPPPGNEQAEILIHKGFPLVCYVKVRLHCRLEVLLAYFGGYMVQYSGI